MSEINIKDDFEAQPGAIALVGSGEFLSVMDTTDLFLLQTLGGPEQARVAVIPTASGLEPGMPQHWAELGLQHFRQLGAQVEAVMILNREAAADPAILEVLSRSNFFYFSGGNPNYLIETLQNSPAWKIIREAHANGAVLAGCSAGAMAFGGYTVSIRAMRAGGSPEWIKALGLLPGVITFPHFDRMGGFIGQDTFKAMIASATALEGGQDGISLIGVDEDTALVRLSPGSPETIEQPRWQVIGRQTVSVFDHEGRPTIYRSGEKIGLQA